MSKRNRSAVWVAAAVVVAAGVTIGAASAFGSGHDPVKPVTAAEHYVNADTLSDISKASIGKPGIRQIKAPCGVGAQIVDFKPIKRNGVACAKVTFVVKGRSARTETACMGDAPDAARPSVSNGAK